MYIVKRIGIKTSNIDQQILKICQYLFPNKNQIIKLVDQLPTYGYSSLKYNPTNILLSMSSVLMSNSCQLFECKPLKLINQKLIFTLKESKPFQFIMELRPMDNTLQILFLIEILRDQYEVNAGHNSLSFKKIKYYVVTFDGNGIAMALKSKIKKCKWQAQRKQYANAKDLQKLKALSTQKPLKSYFREFYKQLELNNKNKRRLFNQQMKETQKVEQDNVEQVQSIENYCIIQETNNNAQQKDNQLILQNQKNNQQFQDLVKVKYEQIQQNQKQEKQKQQNFIIKIEEPIQNNLIINRNDRMQIQQQNIYQTNKPNQIESQKSEIIFQYQNQEQFKKQTKHDTRTNLFNLKQILFQINQMSNIVSSYQTCKINYFLNKHSTYNTMFFNNCTKNIFINQLNNISILSSQNLNQKTVKLSVNNPFGQILPINSNRQCLLLDYPSSNSLYLADIQKQSIVKKFKFNSQIYQLCSFNKSSDQQGYGCLQNKIIKVDVRKKNGYSKSKSYVVNPNFIAITTNQLGNIVTASQNGDIRFYDKFGQVAKNKYKGLGQSIIHLDISKDNKILLGTSDQYLILIVQEQILYKDRIKIETRPIPIKFTLKELDIMQMNLKGKLQFINGKFDKYYQKEKYVLTACQNYLMIWKLQQLINGKQMYKKIRLNERIIDFQYIFYNQIFVLLRHSYAIITLT